MTDPIDEDKIKELASKPKRVSTDEGAITERDVEEQIKADVYTKASKLRKPLFGLIFARFMPGGAD